MTNPFSHPLEVGSSALVHRIVQLRHPAFEAKAWIVRPIDGEPDVYEVRFAGDPKGKTYRRLVHAGVFQTEAQSCLSALSRAWEYQLFQPDDAFGPSASAHSAEAPSAPSGLKFWGR